MNTVNGEKPIERRRRRDDKVVTRDENGKVNIAQSAGAFLTKAQPWLLLICATLLTYIAVTARYGVNLEYRVRVLEASNGEGPRFTSSLSYDGVNDVASLMDQVDLRIVTHGERLSRAESQYRRSVKERLDMMQVGIDRLVDQHDQIIRGSLK